MLNRLYISTLHITIHTFPLLFCAAGQPFGHFLTGYNHRARLLCVKLCLKGISCQYFMQLEYNCCQSLRPRLSNHGENLLLETLHSRYGICCPVWHCIWIRETSPCCFPPALEHLIGQQLVQWLDESGAPVTCYGEGIERLLKAWVGKHCMEARKETEKIRELSC